MVYVPSSPVDELLTMGVNVTVYSGQLDLIVDTIGKSSRGAATSLASFPDCHTLGLHCLPLVVFQVMKTSGVTV